MKMAYKRREENFPLAARSAINIKPPPTKGSIDISLIYERNEGRAHGITMDGKEV